MSTNETDDVLEAFRVHEVKDEERFSILGVRLTGLERKVAVGSFLGVVAAEAVGKGLLQLPEVLQVLLGAAQ